MREAFITASGQHLPGEPVDNDAIERHIGVVSPLTTRLGRLVLRQEKARRTSGPAKADANA